MKNLLFATAIALAAVQCSTAWSGTSQTFTVGFTIPPHAVLTENTLKHEFNQASQMEQVVRGNKTVLVASNVAL